MSTSSTGAWGVLGGTFDPIHYGHLAIAERARDMLGLDRVLFMPSGLPPHKPERIVTPPAHRVAMVELAIAGDRCFAMSRVEVDRPGVSYAVDSLEILARDHGDLVFILSAEALRDLPTWRDPTGVLRLARLAVAPRLGYRTPAVAWLAEQFPGQEDRVVFLDGPELGHSASEIRRLAAAGRSIRYLVPDAVAAYIAEHHLYLPELWAKN